MQGSVLYGVPGKSGSRPGFRPVCADNMPPPSPCQANTNQFLRLPFAYVGARYIVPSLRFLPHVAPSLSRSLCPGGFYREGRHLSFLCACFLFPARLTPLSI